MISLFRETTIGYIAAVIFSVIFGYFIANQFFASNETWSAVIPVILVLLFARLFFHIASKKLAKIYNRYNDCDAESFVNFFEKAAKQRWFRSMKNFVFINLASGYLAVGKTYEATWALRKVGKMPNSKVGLTHQFTYYHLLFNYCVRIQEDIPTAESYVLEMQRLLENPKWKEAQKQPYMTSFAIAQCLLRMAKGDFDGCEAVFLSHRENAEAEIERVVGNFFLGEIYLHENRRADAVDVFTYVALHGGNASFQKRATKHLENLGATVPQPKLQEEKLIIFSLKEQIALYGFVSVSAPLSAFFAAWIIFWPM